MTTKAAKTEKAEKTAAAAAAPAANGNGAAPAETTALATTTGAPPAAPAPAPARVPAPPDNPNLEGSIAAFASGGNFNLANRIAIAISETTLVPPAYRGKQGIPNCLIAIDMANRIGAGVLSVIQHLNVINGKPGWDATFLIGTVNTSKRFGRMKFKFVGTKGKDDWGCYAYAKDLDDGDILEGTTIDIAMAKAEGWYTRTGSKWPTMPQQMLMYRAAAFWTRVYAPEISLGMHTSDELEDFSERPIDVGAAAAVGGLAPIPHADTANSGMRMSLGKPSGSAATAPVIPDAETVPPTPPAAAKAAPELPGPPSVTTAGDDEDKGDAPTEDELASGARPTDGDGQPLLVT